MIFIAWNCRGVRGGSTRRHARDLLKTPNVGALCFLETKTKGADGLLKMADKLGFFSSFMADPLNFAEGLLLVWNKDRVPLFVVEHNSHTIHTLIPRRDGKNIRISFAYVRPNCRAKEIFWRGCRDYSTSFQDPWIVLGDFNDISGQSDKWGTGEIVVSSVDKFLDAMNDCGLMDLGTSGSRFSWYMKVGERVTLRRKLNWVLWNMEAQLSFPEGKAHILPCTHSDHHPVQFDSVAGTPPPKKERPFRFEAVWLLRDDYRGIWHQAWSSFSDNISSVIDHVVKLSKDRNHKTFGNIFHRKKNTLPRIVGIQASPNYSSDRGLLRLEKALLNDLNNTLKQEEVFWNQDATRETPTLRSGRNINSRQAQSLIRHATVGEVRHAVFGMKRFGSPGPDGIQAAFYRHYWDIVGDSVTNFVISCLISGTVPTGMLEAYMTLIPNKNCPENAGDFKPITLLNVIFKIVSKVLVNRLRPVMKKMVGPFQNSFLPGKSTLDNVVMTQEVVHNMSKGQGLHGTQIGYPQGLR
ncbi:PREDICTED: uncharacterized protein LOC109179810 [Ipomoea nil]|uniref:uncharacterized protein LOC109179810 n=1 Tax=Ipomoea nil TaxID=35883 RepID=UPI000901272B|nr:PREDICTED: uncharacterized protein LOC109179810 [Ipomoea nil]